MFDNLYVNTCIISIAKGMHTNQVSKMYRQAKGANKGTQEEEMNIGRQQIQ